MRYLLPFILLTACATTPVRADPPASKADPAAEKAAAEKLAREVSRKAEPAPEPPRSQAQPPTPEYIRCYNAPCEWKAEPGKPVKPIAKCGGGYVSEAIPVVIQTAPKPPREVAFCICCPAVEAK